MTDLFRRQSRQRRESMAAMTVVTSGVNCIESRPLSPRFLSKLDASGITVLRLPGRGSAMNQK